MIAERKVAEIKPVEERPAIAVSLPQPKWYDKLFIASNLCLLAGLLLMAIALMLPANVTLSLFLLIAEVSLYVVAAELFALGFVWPRIK
jgi:hypothetical protein